MQLKTFFLLVGAAIAAAKPSWRELEGYTFDKFVSEHKLNYKSGTSEYATRKALFDKELKRVIAHNKRNASWKENVNHMTAMTAEEKKALNGRSESVAQASVNKLKSQVPASGMRLSTSALPTDVDWRTEGVVTAVKDQGHCGSCWAFAATAVIESHVAIASGKLFDLSPQQIAACSPNPDQCGGVGNCQGATSELAFDYAAQANKGIVESFMYPYTEYYGDESSCKVPTMATGKAHTTGFVQLTSNNYEDLMNAVATQGPIAVSVDASEFHSYDSGIFDGCNQAQPDINHAVVLMGYGTDNGKDYWLIRNSWSASYGEAGYIRIARTSSEQTRCASDITPCDGSACAGTCDTPVEVCGTCGILYDSSYPTGASA